MGNVCPFCHCAFQVNPWKEGIDKPGFIQIKVNTLKGQKNEMRSHRPKNIFREETPDKELTYLNLGTRSNQKSRRYEQIAATCMASLLEA